VSISGRWLDRATLDQMLADLAQRNTYPPGRLP
jgi:hypothetical protein